MTTEPRKLKRAVIKEELVALTGDTEKAIILNQFIYWSERVKDVDAFLKEEKKRLTEHGIDERDAAIDFQKGWIYKKADEMKDEVMSTKSITTIQRVISSLVESEWLHQRKNPKYKWDKTYQYRVNVTKIQQDLYELGYSLEGYTLLSNIQNESSNMHDESSVIQNESSSGHNEDSYIQNEAAIPEITSKITSKDLKQEEEEEIIYTKQQQIFQSLIDFLNIDQKMKKKLLLKIVDLNEYTPDGLYNAFRVLRDRLDDVVKGKKKPIDHLPAWFLETLEGEDTKILMLNAAQVRVLREKQKEEEEARARKEQVEPFPFYNWLEEE